MLFLAFGWRNRPDSAADIRRPGDVGMLLHQLRQLRLRRRVTASENVLSDIAGNPGPPPLGKFQK